MQGPKTLIEAIRYFSDEEVCIKTLAAIRWPDGIIPCPKCGATENYFLQTRKVWKCKACAKQFSIKVGTIFEDSPISLTKWLPCVWMICGAKNGISSYEVHRALGVTQKTAWFMLHRVRAAMHAGTFTTKLGGPEGPEIEIDESYIGGRAKNMHASTRRSLHSLGGGMGKQIVMGFLERGGKVRTFHVAGIRRDVLEPMVRKHVEDGTALYSDSLGSYRYLNEWYRHQVVDHAVEYVRDRIHTNGMENYWSLLKRTIRGTYVSVEPFHLFRYLDEQSFRYNERRDDDRGRFRKALSQIVGRRLTYNELTGKGQPAAGTGA